MRRRAHTRPQHKAHTPHTTTTHPPHTRAHAHTTQTRQPTHQHHPPTTHAANQHHHNPPPPPPTPQNPAKNSCSSSTRAVVGWSRAPPYTTGAATHRISRATLTGVCCSLNGTLCVLYPERATEARHPWPAVSQTWAHCVCVCVCVCACVCVCVCAHHLGASISNTLAGVHTRHRKTNTAARTEPYAFCIQNERPGSADKFIHSSIADICTPT